ncbi:MAG: NAD(P)-dependent oxidoreductase [Thiobacillus sp.]|uniref:NAD-dependent epimerase/dehydratase family protein n=1 Tax=Thiobacillus sp. TaxID=924 RepID=UPI002733C366|nr:NAD(P)-dependent oxidoreductase [Thiobacillus sp.]MDP3584909.1 NAD(P)-dependent oxidoreductase [Thiobacillus sp.]
MKVAVTGAMGFIGRHVVAELAEHAVEVVAVVRPSSTRTLALPAGKVVSLDLHDAPANAFEVLGCPDVLIHLAWDGLPNYKSLHHFETELPAQYRFLKGLIEAGLQNLVVAGTCFEYGMQSGPLSESVAPNPSNPYGFAKDALRSELEYFRKIHPFHLTWARLFYLYGEGQAENSLLPQLRQAVERGDPAFDMSGGEQLRDYLRVDEAARYLVSLAFAMQDVGAVNVCSGTPISVRGLVEGWIKENGWAIRLNLGYYPYPDYEPMAFWGDSTKLSTLIGQAT